MAKSEDSSSDSETGQVDRIAEVDILKRRAKVTSALAVAAIARVRTVVEEAPTPATTAKVRAAASTMKTTVAKALKAVSAALAAKDLPDDLRVIHEAKEVEVESAYVECKFAVETYLRTNDPEAFEERKSSMSIQHDVSSPLHSTVNQGHLAKPSWNEIIQKIPKFNGDVSKFKRWKDAFVLYVDGTSMDRLEKFQLMMKTVGGDVAKCVDRWDVSAENYKSARDAIYDHYGDVNIAEDYHVDNLLKICRSEVNTVPKFIEFVEAIDHSTAALINLGHPYESMSVILSRMILSALPFERRQRFDDVYTPDEGECRLEGIVNFLTLERKQIQRLSDKKKVQTSHIEQRKSRFGQAGNQKGAAPFSKFGNSKHSPAGASGSKSNQYAFAALTEQKPIVDHSCIFCCEQHPSTQCKREMPIDERKRCATTKNACYKCLNRNHRVDKCRGKGCAKCKGRHHVLLCTKSADSVNAGVVQDGASLQVNTVLITNVKERVLPAGYVEVIGDGCETVSRVMLDTGSQKTLITNKLADMLNARTVAMDSFYLQTAGHAAARRCKGRVVEVTLKSRFSGHQMMVHATALKNVVEGILPTANHKGKASPIADSNDGHWPEEINILLGVDFLYPMVGTRIIKEGGYLAIETAFGYFLCGTGQQQEVRVHPVLEGVIRAKQLARAGARRESEAVVSLAAAIKSKFDPEDISFLWETELLGFEPSSKEDDEASTEEVLDFFRKTTKRDPAGRYIIHLPFKPNLNTLGDNRVLTERRLRSFLAQAKKNPQLLEAADLEIQELLDNGFIESTDPPRRGEQAHYLPLLAVIKKQASAEAKMKLRLVNDASARSKDEAGLNDVLFQGGNLIADLLAVILQFRQLNVAITADIEKAYLQNEIVPEHRKFLRFLWPLGVSKNSNAPIRELRSCRLSFGLISAPFLHCATIQLHLENEIAKRPEHGELLNFVKKYFYVDDLVAGADTVEQGKAVVKILREVFAAGCFPLKKWSTNSAELGMFIKQTYPEVSVTYDDSNFKFLGVRWNQKTDGLHVDASKTISFFKEARPSKRSLLKGLSQIFDPLGLVSPIALGLKQLLQKHCKKKFEWDQALVGDDLAEYQEVVLRLANIQNIQVTRSFCGKAGARRSGSRELHVFTDASLNGYGAVAYARTINDRGTAVSMVMSKGRVAPLKGDWSIHRMELLGALIGTRIAKKIREETKGLFDSVHYWCDNACVLAWIRDRPERWKAFIENRVIEIQRDSEANQWQYVRSAENPADLLSRAAALETEESKMFWLQGPEWFRSGKNPTAHSLNPTEYELEVSNERKSECFLSLTAVTVEPLLIKKMSSWPKTIRVMAYLLRMKNAIRSPALRWDKTISTVEYREAETAILRNIQRRSFPAEWESKLENLSKKSALSQFNPFFGEDGLIRCRTRLTQMENVDLETLNPIILPGENYLVDVYIRFIHEKVCMHAGSIVGILQRLRTRFLIIRARRAAKKALSGCKVCAKFRAQVAAEPIPELPKFRVETAVAFGTTGIDAAGPIPVRDSQGVKTPAYIMLFVCAVSRAVRLELVPNLSTYEFLLAMRRFYNRNPTVKCFFSDNAASFKRAAKEVKLLFDLARSAEARSFLSKHRIAWEFNTERSPWRNGFVERTVKVIKDPLRRILGKNTLPFRELETVLTDIEKVVNDRPLTYVSTSPNEVAPLRPSDLMYGSQVQPALPDVKEVVDSCENASATIFSDRWLHQQEILNAFWQRFRKEYLLQLRTAVQNRPIRSKAVQVGDVVLLDDPAPSRSYWPMARVESFCGREGSDGRRRTCMIKLTNGKTLRRPIQLLYPLNLGKF